LVGLFCFNRRLTYKEFLNVLLFLGLPIISMTCYLFLYTPSLKSVLSGTGSNFATSGGFGPNQVATILGLGMFIFSVRFFMTSKTLFFKMINLVLISAIAFRGIITFSRGGVLTGLIMIALFTGLYFLRLKSNLKGRLIAYIGIIALGAVLIWGISSSSTDGLIDKRYANQDATGREKSDVSTGRSSLFLFELEAFKEHPFFGVGVGKLKELRFEKEGVMAASHNEMSRILGEHGSFGLAAFLILLLTPLVYRLENNQNIFAYSFLVFWLLTINHSAMRIAAPAFLYGFSVLKLKLKEL
jgi:O-antigen ligase